MRLTWLADACRDAGLTVVEVPGWKTRGAEFPAKPDTIVCHHTATPSSRKGDYPSLTIVRDGRSDLPGPLSQLGLGRSGTVYVIAAGKANHAGKGAWNGTSNSARTIGIEAEHPGGKTPWTDQQRDAYARLCAALAEGLGVDEQRVCAHREWALPAGRKVDVTFDMGAFRSLVRDYLTKPTPTGDLDMTADELRAIVREEVEKAVRTLHDDHVVLLRGTKTGSHPFNLESIGRALGITK